jgi:hypothetical protein
MLGVSGEGVFVLEFMRVNSVREGVFGNVVVVDGLIDFDSLAQVEHASEEILDLLIIGTILFRVINIFNNSPPLPQVHIIHPFIHILHPFRKLLHCSFFNPSLSISFYNSFFAYSLHFPSHTSPIILPA